MNLTRCLGDNVDVDEHKYNFQHHPQIYFDICFNLLNEDDIVSLKQRITYLRVFCRQDESDSRAYIEPFIREVSRMLPSHLNDATILFLVIPEPNFILFEVNYVNAGHFVLVNIETKEIIIGDHVLDWYAAMKAEEDGLQKADNIVP